MGHLLQKNEAGNYPIKWCENHQFIVGSWQKVNFKGLKIMILKIGAFIPHVLILLKTSTSAALVASMAITKRWENPFVVF